MTAQGWSAEMDRKLAELRKDPGAYFDRAYREAERRRSTTRTLFFGRYRRKNTGTTNSR